MSRHSKIFSCPTYPLPAGHARLHLMPRPWPEPAVFSQLASLGIRHVVSLLQAPEARALGLAEEARLCHNAGMKFTCFPVADHGVPKDMAAFARLAENCHASLCREHDLAIHCFAGIGRTGLLAAAILLREGLGVDQALLRLTRARGIRMPETRAQIQWLHRYQEEFHS